MTDGTMVPERAGILDGSTIGERLRSARRERIVGREAEVALFREAVRGGEQRFAALFVHGPGGVGKTPCSGGSKTSPARRRVARTCLRPARTQELAAEALGLPLSTYERHLRRGVERVVSTLWAREVHGRMPEPASGADRTEIEPRSTWHVSPDGGMLRAMATTRTDHVGGKVAATAGASRVRVGVERLEEARLAGHPRAQQGSGAARSRAALRNGGER